MRFLFLSAQLPGHLDWGGFLPTAVELQQRGHEVLWASGAEVEATVRATGLPFTPLAETGWRWPPPPPLSPDPTQSETEMLAHKQNRALDQWLDVARVTAATTAISALGRQFRPDCIVSEMFMAAAGLAAEMLAVPFTVVGWPAPPPSPGDAPPDAMVTLARARLAELLTRFGVRGVNWSPAGPPALCAPGLHLTYWSQTWYTGVRMGAQTRHVGGLLPAQPPPAPPAHLPAPDDAPWVLITLGTSFNQDPNFFIAASAAVVRLGGLPLLAVGAPLDAPWVRALRPRLPATAVLAARVDFAAVLPYVAAAIHHGGAGTTHALVRHAIPQIVVPHAGDQARQAQGVARTGVGLHIPPAQVTVDLLATGLAALLPDLSTYRAQATALQAEFAGLGGVPAAADILETFVASVGATDATDDHR